MDSAEAIFQFITTNQAAEGLVNDLNSSATTDRFISQLSSQGRSRSALVNSKVDGLGPQREVLGGV